MSPRVQPITAPPEVIELAGLDPVDYREAFTFATGVVRSPEEWARLVLERAPAGKRRQMRIVWTLLGIRLARAGSDGQVLGWRILRTGPDAIVLGVRAALGLTARVVLRVEPGHVVHAMVIRYDRNLAAAIWARLGPKHHAFIAGLLARAARSPE